VWFPPAGHRGGSAESRGVPASNSGGGRLSWMTRPNRRTNLARARWPLASRGLDGGAICTGLTPITLDVPNGVAFAACGQDACKRFSTGLRLADSPTQREAADLQKHHQRPSGPTDHHELGLCLSLRVRGSSLWRPPLTWPFHFRALVPWTIFEPRSGKCVQVASAACTHRPRHRKSAGAGNVCDAPRTTQGIGSPQKSARLTESRLV